MLLLYDIFFHLMPMVGDLVHDIIHDFIVLSLLPSETALLNSPCELFSYFTNIMFNSKSVYWIFINQIPLWYIHANLSDGKLSLAQVGWLSERLQ